MTPLPRWTGCSRKWIGERVHELIDSILEQAPDGPLGELLDPDPTERPAKLKREPAPYFHCASRRMRKILYEAYLWFVVAYREAAEKRKAGQVDVAFPEGCFPPPRPFVPG